MTLCFLLQPVEFQQGVKFASPSPSDPTRKLDDETHLSADTGLTREWTMRHTESISWHWAHQEGVDDETHWVSQLTLGSPGSGRWDTPSLSADTGLTRREWTMRHTESLSWHWAHQGVDDGTHRVCRLTLGSPGGSGRWDTPSLSADTALTREWTMGHTESLDWHWTHQEGVDDETHRVCQLTLHSPGSGRWDTPSLSADTALTREWTMGHTESVDWHWAHQGVDNETHWVCQLTLDSPGSGRWDTPSLSADTALTREWTMRHTESVDWHWAHQGVDDETHRVCQLTLHSPGSGRWDTPSLSACVHHHMSVRMDRWPSPTSSL